MTEALRLNGFYELSCNEMYAIDGGTDWFKVAQSALVGAVIGAIGCGLAGAGCGTVVLPVVGTVTVGAVCAVGGFIGGAIYGAIKEIAMQNL